TLRSAPNFPSLTPAIQKKLSEPILTQHDIENRQRLLEILREGEDERRAEKKVKTAPSIGGSVKNFYESLPKEYKEESEPYDTQDQIKIALPFRLLIVGASGSGKTN